MLKFSFIVPVYNSEIYLKECLDSLIFFENYNSECIIINDGSTDGSLNIINAYKKKYPDFIKVYSQDNKGLSGARNHGINNSEGQYLIFVDSDDILSNSMTTIFEYLLDNDIDIISYDYAIFKSDTNEIVKYKTLSTDESKPYIERAFITNVWCAPFRVYNRNVFNSQKFKKNLYYEDLELIPKLYIESKEIRHINIVGYLYRDNSNGIMGTYNIKKIKDLKLIRKNTDSIEDCNYKFLYKLHISKLINDYESKYQLDISKFENKINLKCISFLSTNKLFYLISPFLYYNITKFIRKMKKLII
jgi:glycosyltransferase involved in cell wall biosynthesis